MFSAVASGIFAYRSAEKSKNGEIGRVPVTLGQTAGVIQEVAKSNGIAANAARSTLSVFSELAKQNKAFEYAGKFTKFAVDNVNPLICASGVVETAMSDDKVGTGITEAAALGTMFAGEALIKQNYDKIANSKTVKNACKKLADSSILKPLAENISKSHAGKAGKIVKGLTFVAGSMASYAAGEKLGKHFSKKVKAELNLENKTEKIDRKA